METLDFLTKGIFQVDAIIVEKWKFVHMEPGVSHQLQYCDHNNFLKKVSISSYSCHCKY